MRVAGYLYSIFIPVGFCFIAVFTILIIKIYMSEIKEKYSSKLDSKVPEGPLKDKWTKI